MPKAEELVVSGLARWGIYGREGTGKSTLLSSTCMCEHPDPEQRCDPNDCLSTLVLSAGVENKKPYLHKPHIDVRPVSKWDSLDALFRALKDKPHKFKVLGFDTWTRMQFLALLKITRGNAASESFDDWLLNPPTRPSNFAQWDSVGALASCGLQQFCQLPMHLIFLFQEDVYRPKSELDPPEIGPLMAGNIAPKQIRTDLELIGRLYVDLEAGLDTGNDNPRAINEDAVEVRKLLVGKQEPYVSKGPTHLIPRIVVNPTWRTLAPSLS